MKFAWFIAVRYLTKGRKNSFISIISLVSILGIAIGVAALIIALSLINGFQNDIRNRILSSSAHIMVTDRLARRICRLPGPEPQIGKGVPGSESRHAGGLWDRAGQGRRHGRSPVPSSAAWTCSGKKRNPG